MKSESAGQKQKKDTKFKPGRSGNPKGKPPGTRNRATMAAQALLDGEGEALTRKAVELAAGGDMAALRLCLERILPPVRERPVFVDLPDISNSESIDKVSAVILQAVAVGELLPGEGIMLSRIVETRRQSLETYELEQRITALEEKK